MLGAAPRVQQRCHWRGRREEREGHLQAHSGLLVVAHCPRQPSHRLFAQCTSASREAAEGQPHVHATGACPHLRGRIWGALARSSSPGGVRSWGWGWGGSRHPDQGWLHCSGRGGLFFSGWVSHCSSFSGHAFALPLFLRAVLASLFCCLPSGLVCYKPLMRCRPHALMALTLCSACPALPVVILLLFPPLCWALPSPRTVLV